MTSSQTCRRGWSSAAAMLLAVLPICAIEQGRPNGYHTAVSQGSAASCDAGVSRHSVRAASSTVPADSTTSAVAVPNAHAGMTWIPGGRFWMGTDHMEDAKPVHEVEIKGFW